ncbi:hypothetical protein Krac_0487 [Ktedonobacter racemifer DSM 44963]|uniref:Uncharacterized protein n=1 Tax=Ktedonobacter racemifer DSM 44963 TaxID=485913 RepID=D6U7U4_KTERA|nr:hypothetical protein Krac_0487 [Ktedonobacter racemifer DSM 44963]
MVLRSCDEVSVVCSCGAVLLVGQPSVDQPLAYLHEHGHWCSWQGPVRCSRDPQLVRVFLSMGGTFTCISPHVASIGAEKNGATSLILLAPGGWANGTDNFETTHKAEAPYDDTW